MTVQKIKLGALVVDGFVLTNPEYPWGYEGNHAPHSGDIPEYEGGEIEIIDSADPEALIKWIPVEHDGKRLMIADRNLLTHISWDQLNEQDLIFGKVIEIRDKRYKLRVLTGGDRPLNGDYEQGGSPLDNEWDTFIGNLAELGSLPEPQGDDLAEYVSEESFEGEHNQFWNWAYTLSWCQETHHEFGSNRAIRGYVSARFWNYATSSSRGASRGWRPVLEVLDSEHLNPGGSLEDRLKDLSEDDLKKLIEDAGEELISRRVASKIHELVDVLISDSNKNK